MIFSGHESFPVRFGWLPHAYRLLSKDTTALARDEFALQQLGIGRNMLKSIRFWLRAFGLVVPGKQAGELELTPFARDVLPPERDKGLDPYLEDPRTIWLLHWALASGRHEKLFAWQFIHYELRRPDFTRSQLLDAFRRESPRWGKVRSDVTLKQHLDIYLNSYLPRPSGRSTLDDVLDCPLADLGLLAVTGRHVAASDRQEDVLAFTGGPRASVTPALFAYLVEDFWHHAEPESTMLDVHVLRYGPGSPGGALKLQETEFNRLVEALPSATGGRIEVEESSLHPRLHRLVRSEQPPCVRSVYSVD